ncbi:histidine kinase [Clostridium novyi A str. 4570]|uniref:Histidine kinase n=1 Tax=Clostridium novyi A str. 4570 TaxID=1444290 RepID=A0AA88ZNZ7_CLONO|nr:PocR ligand-binding domain-containing protein [Clostridium novyi]KGN02189.1 histidine kinase [Clostridium novyi A str. 4570]
MSRGINIKDIINIESFQKIQNDIAKATGVAIITTDYKGKPVTEHSSCTEFCKIIRSKDNLKELCEKCDSRGGLEAARSGRPYIYKCHRGLIDFAVPIIVEEQYLGSLMSGQVLTEDLSGIELEEIIKTNNKNEDDPIINEAYNKLNVIPLEKIKAIANMMFHISNYIIEEVNLKRAEEEVTKKNNNIINAKKSEIGLEKEVNKLLTKKIQGRIDEEFIFNTLNSISSLAFIENANKTREVVNKLASIIRHTLENGSKIIALKEEVNCVLSYLELCKIKFGDRLKFNINIEEEYYNFKIPSMIIYTFVENAINHGIKTKKSEGIINISIIEKEHYLMIVVEDNGVGISERDLLEINNKNDNLKFSTNGISNVRKRMNKFYGYNYKIDINSKINMGTEVKIKIYKDM